MRNLAAVALVFISLNAFVFAENKEENDSSEPPYTSGEIAWNVGIGIASAAAGGVSAAGGNIPGAIVGVANGAKNFLDAAKKYNENVHYERARDNDRHNREERENDSDSWDHDY